MYATVANAAAVGCPACGGPLHRSRFDATFLAPDGSERLAFGLPAGLCGPCRELFVPEVVLALMGLDGLRCVFAIETDLVLQERAMLEASDTGPGPSAHRLVHYAEVPGCPECSYWGRARA